MIDLSDVHPHEWVVVRDESGHHRAVQPCTASFLGLRGDVRVDKGADYYHASRKADELNGISEIMSS